MDGLDFSQLTDDQLIGLLRAVLRECVDRGGAIQAASQAAALDEAERAQIQKEAAEREAAKLRAQEREHVAREAAEAVRRQRDAQEAAAKQAAGIEAARQKQEADEAARVKAAEAGRLAAQQAWLREQEEKNWLVECARLVEEEPKDISLIVYDGRVLVNPGSDRYERHHYVDWNSRTNKISTVQELIGKKSELIEFCARWYASPGTAELIGTNYEWKKENEPCPTT